MSMNAVFVQVEPQALAKIQATPELAESLFFSHQGSIRGSIQGSIPGSIHASTVPAQFAQPNEALQERVRAAGPQIIAQVLAGLDPATRQQLEARLGHSAEAFASGAGGDDLLKMLQQRGQRAADRANLAANLDGAERLSLDKEWHGVHYMLCGQTEPGKSLLSQAVMGGADLGDDDEGFSGYGPARAFTVKQVAEIGAALSGPAVETEAAARFDAARMTKLGIYPGFEPSDRDPLLDALRRLREFYADAASKGNGIVTCLV